MDITRIITASGPILGLIGWFTPLPWLFWIGVAICSFNLFFNLASGAMNFPLLPGLFMFFGLFQSSPWHIGLGLGLILWTALEAVGDAFPKFKIE